ncbi:hypothetical protein NCER_101691 [Vairimorpha ceranae BRL01]|uniref:Uncharacterized protein n=2 Tax=Vairimorpha ceranae TaxID=40302 RepID=C4VAK3_VAIC1|nr:hypothetical protein AAJ76_320006697 [Vairimorpha ceranae]EEQ81749.1 hypothetical protein NCER_101691 [Vairimorpha ceranae BRL01]KAF5141105.1 hypothetical protein G9O61_00g007960 [Vairimorpha ceranae]KKO75098.1 hypothetical protein AAJ76_320006697 [Vairimorpha ceranae]
MNSKLYKKLFMFCILLSNVSLVFINDMQDTDSSDLEEYNTHRAVRLLFMNWCDERVNINDYDQTPHFGFFGHRDSFLGRIELQAILILLFIILFSFLKILIGKMTYN